jgi:hypothetical protein
MAITLKILCNMYDITSGKITLGLDGKSALNSATSEFDPYCQKRDFDLLWEARKQLEDLPIEVDFRWVEGHQDDDPRPMQILPDDLITGTQRHYGCLDRWAKLNIEADQKAKDFWQVHHNTSVPNTKFTKKQMAVSFRGSS